MSIVKCLLVIVVLVSCSVDAAGRRKRAVTNCVALKSCVEAVAAKPGCGCSAPEMQSDIDSYNTCLQQQGVRDRCPQNRANYVCFNFESQQCDADVESCYERFHDDLTAAEEAGHDICDKED